MKNKSRTLALAATNANDVPNATVNHDVLLAATSQIVSAYIANRGSEELNLTALTSDVYATLRNLASADAAQHSTNVTGGSNRKPVVSVEDSVKADYLVCLEDGTRVKMLKRHLKTAYGMSPEQYRARWDLPATYPMVAPNYAKVRSNLAKQIGLGRRSSLSVAKARMNAAAANLR